LENIGIDTHIKKKLFEALTTGTDTYIWALSVPVPVHIFGKYGYRYQRKNRNLDGSITGTDTYIWALSVPVPVHIFGKYGVPVPKKNRKF
jgi:hypothetical protein